MAVLLIPALLLGGTVADIAAAFQSRQLRGNVIGGAAEGGEVVLAAEGGADTGSLYAYGTLGGRVCTRRGGSCLTGSIFFGGLRHIRGKEPFFGTDGERRCLFLGGYGANGCLGGMAILRKGWHRRRSKR